MMKQKTPLLNEISGESTYGNKEKGINVILYKGQFYFMNMFR
jgi:hypothetical protein